MNTDNLGKIYVTGADGFIGSHLVERLLSFGCEVTALCVYNSNGSYGWLDSYSGQKTQKLNLLLGDVRDPFFMDRTIKGHDTVFHLASLIAIPYSYQAPQSYFETNVNGAINIAEAAKRHGVKRLVHTSTSEVYGTARRVPIDEEHPLQGQSPYSASKIAADMLIQSYFSSFNLPAVTLRPFNTYGPRQSLRAVIPSLISQVLNGQSEIRMGSLSPTRDFNFVSDTVDAFISLGCSPDESLFGETFNAGSGIEISIGDLVKLVAKVLNRDVQVVTEEERIRPEKSEVERLLADASKLRKATGWAPKVTLEEGLAKVAEWIEVSNFKQRASHYHR